MTPGAREREAARAGACAAFRATCEMLATIGADAEWVRHIAENAEAMADGIADDYRRECRRREAESVTEEQRAENRIVHDLDHDVRTAWR